MLKAELEIKVVEIDSQERASTFETQIGAAIKVLATSRAPQ